MARDDSGNELSRSEDSSTPFLTSTPVIPRSSTMLWWCVGMITQCGIAIGLIHSRIGRSTSLQARFNESRGRLDRHKDFLVVFEAERGKIYAQAVTIWKRKRDFADCLVLFQNGSPEGMKRLLERSALVGRESFEQHEARLLPANVEVNFVGTV